MNKAYIAPAAYPATISVLFLRVDFPPDADATTTGTGEWTDSTYAYSGNADYWVNRNQTLFVAYYSEVSYGKLTVNVTVSPAVYRLPSKMANYNDSSSSSIESLICDGVNAADSAIDFSLYDAVVIVHAGAGEEADVNMTAPTISGLCITPTRASQRQIAPPG